MPKQNKSVMFRDGKTVMEAKVSDEVYHQAVLQSQTQRIKLGEILRKMFKAGRLKAKPAPQSHLDLIGVSRDVLKWWDSDARFATTKVDGEEDNVFYGEPKPITKLRSTLESLGETKPKPKKKS